jgi:hypothetical protein
VVPIGLLTFLPALYLAYSEQGNARRPAMNGIEQINQSLDWQQLAQENGSLRIIIAELLIKNQKLRWELSGPRTGNV